MKQIKKVIAHSLVAVLCLSSFLTNTASTEAKAKKPKLSQKSITLTKGKSKTLKVKNTKKCKVTWKTSKKKVVSISKKKRTSCKLKAKAKGTAKITCTVKRKKKTYKLTCKVKVKAKKTVVASSLKDTYTKIVPYMGTCLNYGSASNPRELQNASTMKFVKKQYNSFTLENEMKPDAILGSSAKLISVADAKKKGYYIPAGYAESTVPELAFTTVDKSLEAAKNNGLKMRAHTLVWHSQTPSWFFTKNYDGSKVVTPAVMDARLDFYIHNVMGHVMDKEKALTGSAGSIVYAWDVVNEYLHRPSFAFFKTWTSVYGDMGNSPSYVKKAFEIAYDMLKSYQATDKVTLFYNDYAIILIYTDPEMQGSRVQVFVKRPAVPEQYNNLVYGEMLDVVQAYMTTMENARLQEISMQPDAPFLGAGMNSGSIGVIPTLEATTFVAMTQDGKLAQGFEALYTEMEKVRRYGFTQGEFERAQNDLMRRAERSYTNRNDRRNAEFVQTYLDNYQQNTPMPDAETEWQLDSMLIKALNVEAVNAFAQQAIYPNNQVIVITAPEKEGVVNPTAEEILAIRDKVAAAEIEAYEDNTVKEPLIPEGTALNGSPVKKTAQNAEYGATEWTLANGVKVIVKPTTYKADEVRMYAQAKGGLSILTDEEFYMGEMMPAFNSMSGVGKFSATDLKKQLSGKSASVQPSVENYASEMNGFCSPKDLETMFQLLYLNFTQPRFDENDYNTLMKMLRAQLENVKSNPDYLMEDKFIDVVYGNNPRRQMVSTEIIDKFSFEALPAIYKKLYPDANSFVFKFVGNVDLETLKPLVEKYIGSLPTSKKPMTFVDDKCAPVKGEVTEDFTASMQQPKVSVRYRFSGEMPYTLKNKAALTFLTQALNSRYLVSIREEKGGTYGVQVSGSTEYIPSETYDMTISFDTNEEMADELREIVMKEIEEIAANGPKSEDIEKNREFMLKSWKNSLEQNAGWMNYLNSKYGSGLDYLADYEEVLKTLTNADVQAMAKKVLADGNLVKVIMRPAKEEAK